MGTSGRAKIVFGSATLILSMEGIAAAAEWADFSPPGVGNSGVGVPIISAAFAEGLTWQLAAIKQKKAITRIAINSGFDRNVYVFIERCKLT